MRAASVAKGWVVVSVPATVLVQTRVCLVGLAPVLVPQGSGEGIGFGHPPEAGSRDDAGPVGKGADDHERKAYDLKNLQLCHFV